MTADPDEVLIRVDGSVGVMTLNRPKAINSLNHNMVDLIDRALTQWADDPAITAVVVSPVPASGVCAQAATSSRSITAPAPAAPTPASSGSTSTASTRRSAASPSPTCP